MPCKNEDGLFVTSHVGRDLLQTAALFSKEWIVVWEYVVNELQYREPGVVPLVKVQTARKTINIAGNGRGMDWAGLQHFFQMHGENRERLTGNPGRGLNGTGKSAAFGIGDVLRLRTTRDGLRCTVELRRGDIQDMSTGDPVPVRELEKNAPTAEPNGTTVTIEGIHLRAVNEREIIRYIERNLATSRQAGKVWVNDHLCVYQEPEARLVRTYRPEGELARLLGDVQLTLKVSKAPLDKDLRGVTISSNGVWHEQTLAGCENQDMAHWIFGAIDVPRLDEEVNGPIPPFNQSRRLELNPNNTVVAAIYAFIGPKIDRLRQDLVREKQEAKKAEDARQLAKHGSDIARLLNADFRDFRDRVSCRRVRVDGGFDRFQSLGNGDQRVLVPGTDVAAREDDRNGVHEGKKRTDGDGRHPLLEQDDCPNAERKGKYIPGAARHTAENGGFRVEFQHMGGEADRAKYLPDERTIYLNLDHPQIKAALGPGNVEDPMFRRLSYEVAFAEYAVALAHELNNEGEFRDTSEPMVEIRRTLNRISRSAAPLYAAVRQE